MNKKIIAIILFIVICLTACGTAVTPTTTFPPKPTLPPEAQTIEPGQQVDSPNNINFGFIREVKSILTITQDYITSYEIDLNNLILVLYYEGIEDTFSGIKQENLPQAVANILQLNDFVIEYITHLYVTVYINEFEYCTVDLANNEIIYLDR